MLQTNVTSSRKIKHSGSFNNIGKYYEKNSFLNCFAIDSYSFC